MPTGVFINPKVRGERISRAMKGNKNGLGHQVSEEHKKKIILAHKGKKASEKVRRKMSEAKRGKVGNNKGMHWKIKDTSKMKGHIRPKSVRKKISEWQIAHPNRKFKDTDIELKIGAELKKRNINYQKQVPLCKIAIVDFYLPEYRIVIECDGDYWHKREKTMVKDEEKTRVLTFNGFNVYRFWGHEIEKSAEECINKITI